MAVDATTISERREQAEGRQVMRMIAGFAAVFCAVIWLALLLFQQALIPQLPANIAGGAEGELQQVILAGGWSTRIAELFTFAFVLLLVVPFGTLDRVRAYASGPGGFSAVAGCIGVFLMVFTNLISATSYDLLARMYQDTATRPFAISLSAWVNAVFEGPVQALGILFIGIWIGLICLVVPPRTLMQRVLVYYGLPVSFGLIVHGIIGTFEHIFGNQILEVTRIFFWILLPFWVAWVGFWLLRPGRVTIVEEGEQVMIVSPDAQVVTAPQAYNQAGIEVVPEGDVAEDQDQRQR